MWIAEARTQMTQSSTSWQVDRQLMVVVVVVVVVLFVVVQH